MELKELKKKIIERLGIRWHTPETDLIVNTFGWYIGKGFNLGQDEDEAILKLLDKIITEWINLKYPAPPKDRNKVIDKWCRNCPVLDIDVYCNQYCRKYPPKRSSE